MMTVNRSNAISLEIEFEDQHILEVNLAEKCDFEDYLSPNEKSPIGIIKHLELSERGIIVSTGTERSFFDLLFSNATKCEGLVIRDINPKVKAYVDFNAALIRISDTYKEYTKWSKKTLSEPIQISQTIKKISAKIAKATIPQKIKDYYLHNAMAFGDIYLRADKSWRSQKDFNENHYHQDSEQFFKIKSYIEAGNVISTIGEINDLTFLKNRNIAIVDTSNISDYSLLDLQGDGNFHPRVIWTSLPIGCPTQYYSYIHSPIEESDRDTFEKLIAKIRYAWRNGVVVENFSAWMSQQLRKYDQGDDFTRSVGGIYSLATLQALKIFYADNLLEVCPNDSFPIYIYSKDIDRLNFVHTNYLNQLCKSEEIKRFIPYLVNYSSLFKPEVILALSTIEEWRVMFENHYSSPYTDFKFFLEKLKEGNVLVEFTLNFGKERLANLHQQYEMAFKENLANRRSKRVQINVK